MKKIGIVLICLLMGALLFTGCKGGESAVQENDGDKKAILAVSFGTSYADTRALTLDAIQEDIASKYPEYDVKRAFTSQIIIDHIDQRDNIKVNNLEEALTSLEKDNYKNVIIQPFHVIPGHEYNEILAAVREHEKNFNSIKVGKSLLWDVEDYRTAVKAVKNQLPELAADEAVVFMGHGTEHPANACYSQLQMILKEELDVPVYLGTVEGYPTLDNVIADLKANNIKKVVLMPFMVVAGDHANNDMAGEDPDSWKSVLKKEGFTVESYVHGLGENEAIRQIYVNRVAECLNSTETE